MIHPDDRPLLEVSGLRKSFDLSKPFINRLIERSERQFIKAVDGVDFTIQRGQTLSLVGESGCGKSTVAKLIMGLSRPSGGSIRFEGTELADQPAGKPAQLRRRMQMIFQDPYASLNPRKRVADIVAEPLEIHRCGTRAEIAARVAALIARVGLPPEAARRFPHEFSGGQRQRVCIARALALNPSVIIADEPVSALDVSIQAQILDLIEEIQNEFNVAILFISHDMAVVEKVADRIAVMYQGELIEIGPRDSVLRQPAHPYTRRLLDAVPIAHPEQRRERLIAAREIASPIRPAGAEPDPFVMDEIAPRHFLRRSLAG